MLFHRLFHTIFLFDKFSVHFYHFIPSYWNLIYSTNLKLNNVLCKVILLYFQHCLNFKSRNATHLLSLPYALAWAIASRLYINLEYILWRK